MLKGWANYHRYVITGKAFEYVDNYVYSQLWRLLKKRHDGKPIRWLAKKYWLRSREPWTFTVASNDKEYAVFQTKSAATHRYRKIKSEANPYLKEYIMYFINRKNDKGAKLRTRLSAREFQNAQKLMAPFFSKEAIAEKPS